MGPSRSGFERLVGAGWRATLDLLLPSQCPACDRPVDGPGQFCPACFGRLQLGGASCCRRCGAASRAASHPGAVCGACEADPPPWGEARAALRYDDAARRIILPLKYGDRTEAARVLAPLMARAGADVVALADWLVPVPLHRRRLLQRRYNQAALLAQAVGRLAGRPVLVDALRRVRATAPLAEMSPVRRAQEVSGAIAARPSRRAALQDSRVLLVDDVLTSGSTARACVSALLEAGVARVDVLAAARTQGPSRPS